MDGRTFALRRRGGEHHRRDPDREQYQHPASTRVPASSAKALRHKPLVPYRDAPGRFAQPLGRRWSLAIVSAESPTVPTSTGDCPPLIEAFLESPTVPTPATDRPRVITPVQFPTIPTPTANRPPLIEAPVEFRTILTPTADRPHVITPVQFPTIPTPTTDRPPLVEAPSELRTIPTPTTDHPPLVEAPSGFLVVAAVQFRTVPMPAGGCLPLGGGFVELRTIPTPAMDHPRLEIAAVGSRGLPTSAAGRPLLVERPQSLPHPLVISRHMSTLGRARCSVWASTRGNRLSVDSFSAVDNSAVSG
ncbi:hypothetical protein DFR76_109298 [Nocardia pseudobrasiliensis]|uniref:Uncharacterized protein n=1 Tax=Nocardia pseudobrasiliensis TaxID=45979 RepID=A0A370HZS7_9NOCA|nr:hypothetical protein DFR76_109298 [Nocardia pseudobrasiliensis]